MTWRFNEPGQLCPVYCRNNPQEIVTPEWPYTVSSSVSLYQVSVTLGDRPYIAGAALYPCVANFILAAV